MLLKREIVICGDIARVPLSRGAVAIIDAADAGLVAGKNWYRSSAGYAVTKATIEGKQATVLMHRLICQTPKDLDTDHINGDRLDNRRGNLRIATRSQNMLNTGAYSTNRSGYKGVCWATGPQRWKAQALRNGKMISLGYYTSAEEAHAAYIAFVAKHDGEFARVA